MWQLSCCKYGKTLLKHLSKGCYSAIFSFCCFNSDKNSNEFLKVKQDVKRGKCRYSRFWALVQIRMKMNGCCQIKDVLKWHVLLGRGIDRELPLETMSTLLLLLDKTQNIQWKLWYITREAESGWALSAAVNYDFLWALGLSCESS